MKQTVLFIICLLFGLLFINAGMDKFFHYMPMPDDMPEAAMNVMTAFMEIGWLLPLVAVAEILGGILFIIPKTRALGAVVVFPVLVGIMLTNLIHTPSGLPIAIPLFIIELWVLYENRQKYAPMLQKKQSN